MATGNYFNQEVSLRDAFDPGAAGVGAIFTTEKPNFWLLDVTAGYKLPKRYGSIVLEGRNITDREFGVFDRTVEEGIIPARAVILALNVTL